MIVKPNEAFSTAAMYRAIDAQTPVRRHTTDELTAELSRGDLNGVAAKLNNTFEAVVPQDSAVWTVRQQLLTHGALNAMMSGSGSAVFGIFTSKAQAQNACASMQDSDSRQVFLCKPV